MRDVGVGRSGGLTDWYLMNVADMWACVQDHQTEQHWRHVAGWRKVCDLAGQHLTRLKAYREGLARAWPPETNAAARAYVTELDNLIDQVQRTHDAASANQTALSAATQAITSTRTELSKIYEEYAGKLRQKRTWEEIAADAKAAAGSRASESPVTDADLERLNVRARGIMYGLSSELQQAQAMLRQPPPSTRQGDRAPDYSDPYASAGAAPIIPPIVPVSLSRSVIPPTRSSPIPKAIAAPQAPAVGPVLGGASPSPSPASPPGNPPALSPGNSASPNTSSNLLPSVGLGTGTNPLGRGQIGQPTTNGAPRLAAPTSPRAAAPSGFIGQPLSPGAVQPTSGGTQPRRVNPVGGVIGGGGAGTTPTGAAGSRPGGKGSPGISYGAPNIGLPLGQGIASGRSFERKPGISDPRKWDPDEPWRMDQGVDPVVRPPENEGPIDPGPAIGIPR
ncbi:hypothetical protein OIE53_18250 [Micromonospora sp. NBC_01739]|nr:hypothetical protein OIE53_18250 [Micromonospora sp. NBC_01739]